MTFAQAVDTLGKHFASTGKNAPDAEAALLSFLGWDEPEEEDFANDVRIVLASAEFSRELTTAVLWLNDHGLDVRCVRLKPYRLEDRTLLDVQQIIPLPEAADYQVRVREKSEEQRRAKTSTVDFTRYDLTIAGETYPSLWKRQLVFRCVRAAIEDAGARPEDLSALFQDGRTRWISLEGDLDAAEFVAECAHRASNGGPTFDARRYFTREDELFRVNGRTYAFSNQWGGDQALSTVKAIRDHYPSLHIGYQKAST